jgi:ACS family tartrate transporter-like MFS transporter
MEDIATVEKTTMRKVKWKVLPFCLALYLINYIDRICIGFGALDMNRELGISNAAYGFLSSAFFIGYFFLEVPSNMCLHKFGARRWMARIIISWGLVTMAMFFVQNYTHVLTVRIFLGIAEAGFFPGMIYFFTFWFPAKERASIIGFFMLAVPFGNFVAAPVSTLIMDNIHWFGLSGWRWMFMIEGGIAVVLGVIAIFALVDRPADATWLADEEKKWLTDKLTNEEEYKKDTAHLSLSQIFAHPKIWVLGLIYFSVQTTTQSVNYWMPIIVKGFSSEWSNTTVGIVLMLPGIISLVVMPFWGLHSDKQRERKWHTALPIVMSAVGLLMVGFCDGIPLRLTGVILNAVGNVAFYGPFWALPSIYLTGRAAAIGVAIINSLSSAGGFIGNSVIGVIKDTSAGTAGVLTFQAAMCLVAFFVTISLNLKDKALSNS